MAGLFVAATGIFRFLGFAIGAGHGFGMKHTHGLFAGEYEAEAFTGLGGDVGLVIPTLDVVFQLLLFGDQRSLLTLETIEFGQVQGIGVEGGDQLDGAKGDNEQGDEERYRPRRPFFLTRALPVLPGLPVRDDLLMSHENTRRIRLDEYDGYRASVETHAFTGVSAHLARYFLQALKAL